MQPRTFGTKFRCQETPSPSGNRARGRLPLSPISGNPAGMRVSTNASAAVSTTSTITASAVATPATITAAAAVHSRGNGREDTIQGIEHAEIQVERSEVEAA